MFSPEDYVIFVTISGFEIFTRKKDDGTRKNNISCQSIENVFEKKVFSISIFSWKAKFWFTPIFKFHGAYLNKSLTLRFGKGGWALLNPIMPWTILFYVPRLNKKAEDYINSNRTKSTSQ